MATASASESLYERCSRVIRQDFVTQAEPFTEIDVVNAISKRNWGSTEFARGLVEAQQICASLFRTSRLVRFGPVKLPRQEHPDFVRRGNGGKILYAGSGLVKRVETVNGTFLAVNYARAREIGLVRSGRSAGIDRDDFKPWAEQNVRPSKDIESLANGNGDNDLQRLRANLEAANRRVDELVAENERLKARIPEVDDTVLVELPLTEELFEQLVALPRFQARTLDS